MAVIIGAGTTVNFDGACVVSANWGYNPNTTRLYCVGDWSPSFQYNKPTETLSIVIYSGTGGPVYSTEPTEECADANTINASISLAECATNEPVDDLSGDWFVVNYGFSKDDPLLPGQETWGLQRWVEDATTNTPEPSYVIRGISEGSGTYLAEDADPGVSFTGVLSYSSTGNVSANSLGRHDRIRYGVVIQIGGSESPANGKTGQGSVSIPYTPLWLG